MKTYMTSIAMGLFLLAVLLPSTSAHAQLHEVKQTVYGMDCAPCAYAQENRLKAMDGVEAVSVSLNDGMAAIKFQPNNEITLEQIREAVRKSGFSAEEAAVTLQGRLGKENGRWILTTPVGERYRLKDVGDIPPADTEMSATVTGTVPKGEASDEGWVLQVTALNSQT